jgi:signal transduction histidine kinase
MRNTLPIALIAAAAALLSIIGVTGVVAVRRANSINEEIVAIHSKYYRAERNLQGLREDLDATRVYVRDYMLDPAAETASATSIRFLNLEESVESRLKDLTLVLGAEEAASIRELRAGLEQYFNFLFSIPEAGRLGFPQGTSGIRRQLRSRREEIVTLAREVAQIEERRFAKGNEEVEEARRILSTYLWRMTGTALALGVAITFLGGHRIRVLQKRDQAHRMQIEHSEAELRYLSKELVRAQEEERKFLSRELHDEVGQTLTALGIEIGNIERLRQQDGPEFAEHAAGAKQLVQRTLRTVRDLAMGLRPTLLDDSGLVPAVRWHIREFSKRTGVPVDLQIDGKLEGLTDRLNTSIYRIVQEALTNCARHADARNIRVALHGNDGEIALAVQDDGVGFSPSVKTGGLGIAGIDERVKELGGNLRIESEGGRGTLLFVEIPLERPA